MRAVVRKELAVLWLSPVPYVVAALFHVVLAVLFLNQLEIREQALSQPLFPVAGFLLLITVPVLCMRSVADEARTGSLELLLAVPVRGRTLVVGKWLACWVTALALIAPASLFPALLAWWGDPDPGPIITGFVGLALLGAALAAVGVMASSFTSSQPVAAMVAFFVALLLWFSHVGSDGLTVGSVLAHFSLSERMRTFAAGVLDTADITFFVVLVAAALVVATTAVESRRMR